ncbi:hypothetical protein MKW98_007639 [Papaver atlanticum]|uniref:Uncharacterized protein n=1 Tax=Papaver atlanticum TaxID=357466 RepID=A0AAD4X8L7_9MAGN|nr:hypothetical protein MKW98_007639 [Papaver atlanticum]
MEEETIECDEARHLGYKAKKVLDDVFFKYETKPNLTSLASSITKGDWIVVNGVDGIWNYMNEPTSFEFGKITYSY